MKFKALTSLLFSVLGIGLIQKAWSFEEETHERITQRAFDRSVLGKGYLRNQLGIGLDQTFNGWRADRWLVYGSNQEDNKYDFPVTLFRFRNHFFDPINQSGLNYGLITGAPAPDWALQDSLTQDYSWQNAREYFFLGLTASDPATRETNMAKTFRALGQVIHVIQDMGSPEHTRNDPHAGILEPLGFPFGAPSLFEGYKRILGDNFIYDKYGVPSFPNTRDYWRDGNGKGLAEYTNRNFISKSTNFTLTQEGNTGVGYALPTLSIQPGWSEVKFFHELFPGTPVTSDKVTFFFNSMEDPANLGPTELNTRMTAYSYFDQDLREVFETERFSINESTVKAAAEFLVPRATSYSTGLINHFFRGRLRAELRHVEGVPVSYPPFYYAEPPYSVKLQTASSS